MKRKFIQIFSLILAILMVGGILASCAKDLPDDEETESTTAPNENDSSNDDSASGGSATSSIESNSGETENGGSTPSTGETGSETSGETDPGETNPGETNPGETNPGETKPSTDVTVPEDSKPEESDTEKVDPSGSAHDPSVEYANSLTNGVQSYYTEAGRNNYQIENLNMNLLYSLTDTKLPLALTNKDGGVYIANTMDVFVKMKDGNRLFVSNSANMVRPNIYRLGYYYYDVHFLDQDFLGKKTVVETKNFNPKDFTGLRDVSNFDAKGISFSLNANPGGYIYAPNASHKASEYNAVTFEIRATNLTGVKMYYIAGDNAGGHNESQSVEVSVKADGENFYECIVILSEGQDYNGVVKSLRMDFEGISKGEFIEVKNLKLAKVTTEGPQLYLDRTFHTYSDKLHQELHFIATQEVSGIEEVGMITHVEAARVAALVVKDSNGLHYTIDAVDWATAEYIGFDIKDVGVFGYILPNHKDAGSISVELVDGYYVITQITCPEGGTLLPINGKVTYTDNDFFTGQRIYTDTNHDFTAFIREAEFERKPLGREINSDKFIGYEYFKGSYKFEIGGTGFNAPFFYDQNFYYNIAIQFRSSVDRPIYIRTFADTGCLENAVLLNGSDLLLPISPEVSKNFGGEDEEPLYNSGDHVYGETLFPLLLPANTRVDIKVLNLYQNWGKYPLKQLSSIQYFWPYYHLSLGTTETSCISPWYGARDLWTLPDFRSQSMPYWFELDKDKGYSNQPQHTHAGLQYFLQYTAADGNHYATENISNVINSSGPVYADVDMTYISDDNKIKVVYKHIEMPQEDELRAYYEIEYEILEELTINDFKNNFSFYSFEGYAGKYYKMGYLDEGGNHVHKDTNLTDVSELIVLGKESPYVSLYDLHTGDPKSTWTLNNANLGMVIYNSEFIFSGTKCDKNFVITGANAKYSLSLNIDEITLKPGDTMKINMIVMPWGHYDSTDDASVRNVRENTCIDPLGIDVVKGIEMESVFLPKLRSDDGKSAEFTIHGGTDNVVVRVYGFEKNTAPKIYVKDGDNWVDFVVSSINTPDKMGNRQYYDGYFAYYDEDGTYSYAFAIDADEYKDCTFRIEADYEFKRWPTVIENAGSDLLNVFLPSYNLYAITNDHIKGISKAELAEDGSYVRYYGDGLGTGEAYFEVYKAKEKLETGKYIVLKYRIPTTNQSFNHFQFFSTTSTDVAMPECGISAGTTYTDDEWHIMIVNAEGKSHPYFEADGDGYYAQYLRLDVFNTAMSTECYVDIAYIGMTNDISKVFEVEKMQADPCDSVTVYTAKNAYVTYDLFGNAINEGESSPTTAGTIGRKVYIHPENAQGYTQSSTSYVAGIDFINGKGDGDPDDPAFNSYRSHEVAGIKVITYNGATIGNSYLVMSGWTLVYEGVEKFVWSADGGRTWHDAICYPDTKELGAASGGIKDAGDNHFTGQVAGFDKDTYDQSYYESCVYQGVADSPAGIAADLSAYVGSEVNVTFAAVPKNDTDGLVLISQIQKVRVYENDEAAAEGERCKHTDVETYIFIDDKNPATEKAIVEKRCRCGEVVLSTGDPNYILFIGKFGSVSVAPTAPESAKGFITIDATNHLAGGVVKTFAANEKGELFVDGWGGLNGGIGDVVFKVYDAKGNELTSGWTSASPTLTSRGDIGGEMIQREIAIADGKGIQFTIHLERYIKAKNDVVTVRLAYVAAGAPAGSNDKYVEICEIVNVKVPAEPVDYVEPEPEPEPEPDPDPDPKPDPDPNPPVQEDSYIDPDNAQGYNKSNTSYVAGIDFINGIGDGEIDNPAFNGYRSHDVIGAKVIDFNGTTVGNAYLAMAGWTLVYEGVEKFVWSADGGKTWHEVVLYPATKTLSAATGGIKDAGDGHFAARIPGFDAEAYNQEYYANCVYQGATNTPAGIAAHLTDYIGQSVDVTFAVVPKNDTDGLCIIAHVQNVRVYASDEDAEAGEPCTHTKVESYAFVSDDDPNTENALIVKKCRCGQIIGTASVPSYVLFIGNIGGVNVAPTAPDHNKGYVTIDATNHIVNGNVNTFAANADGDLKIDGWAGLNGGIGDIVFKVFDADGNELTSGWTSTMATLTYRGDLASEMTKRGIEGEYGKGFAFTLHLARYVKAKNDAVTVKLAFVAKGAPKDGNDIYVDLCQITNVLVPAEPVEYFVPEIPEASDKTFVAYFDSIEGTDSTAVKGSTRKDVYIYDFSSALSKGNATLTLVGWTGVKGGATALAYRITSKDGTTDWIILNQGLSDAASDVENAVIGSQPSIAAEHAYRFSIVANLSEYVGRSVTVTFGIVSADDGSIIPCFMANNVKVYCDHTTIDTNSDYEFIGDSDDSTDEAKIAAKCICGQLAPALSPTYVFNFQEVVGSVSTKNLHSFETAKGYRIINAADYNITADSNGKIEIDGWGGVVGGSSKIVFKICASDGTELTAGWTDFDSTRIFASVSELSGEMTKRGIDASYGMRYMDLVIDLNEYLAESSSITIKFAMVCDGAPEGSNDKYLYMGEIQNVTATK